MERAKIKMNHISKKAVALVLLFAVLIFSLAALSYAWYRNYIDIRGSEIVTGKISLQINGYRVDGAHNVTAIDPINVDGEPKGSVLIESSTADIIGYQSAVHFYYFIKNPASDTSVDLDASIAVSIDNTSIDPDLHGIKVYVSEVSSGTLTNEINNLTEDGIKALIGQASQSGITTQGEGSTINNLENARAEISVPKGSYSFVRVTYTMPDELAGYGDISLRTRMSLFLAQENGLPGATSNSEYIVYSLEGLQTVLASYRANDKVVVKSNIEYIGDMVLNKPLTLEIQNADLEIYGNLICAYDKQSRYTIDTSRGGAITVFKKSIEKYDSLGNLEAVEKIGGDIKIDSPLSQIELIGKNSEDITLGDIYIEGRLYVNASMPTTGNLYGQGFIVNGSNIYPILASKGDSSGYKDINIGPYTRVSVMNYSKVGNILSTSSVIEIENRGTIGKINLSGMVMDENYVSGQPQILINHYGALTDTGVSLPLWAERFTNNGDNTYSGNTRIVSQPGAGFMAVDTPTDGFVSDGSKDPAKDHIEYVKLETFVEKVNGKSDEILVQYTRETGLFLVGTSIDIGTSLRTLVGYYMGNVEAADVPMSQTGSYVNTSLKISPVDSIKYIKIECYSTTELSGDDYGFIKEMASLVSIDLSDAASVGLATPDEAFKDLSNLESAVMSRFDGSWGDNIFTGTKIDEVWLPDSLISIKSENTFDNIKYVHTAARYVEGASNGVRLLFVPDTTTFDSYLDDGHYGRIFYDADRYTLDTGDYFLRLDVENKTAEFVAFMPSGYAYTNFDIAVEKNGEAKFDFNNITVNGAEYSIKIYGTYSFYGKTFINSVGNKITIGNLVESIQAYAFGSATGVGTLTFEGATSLEADSLRGLNIATVNINESSHIGENAFKGAQTVVINAPKVEETDKNAFAEMTKLQIAYLPSLRRTNEPFYGCTGIFRLDIGIFEKDTLFGQNSTNIKYTFIHVSEDDNPDNYTYQLTYTGVNIADNGSRWLFVPSSYAKIYTNYGVKINIEDNPVESIKEYYNTSDANVVSGYTRPNMFYLDNGDGTVEILAYHKTNPTSISTLFDVPKNDGSGEKYAVTKIGDYAYQSVTVTANSLTFPSSIKEIGAYSFSGSNKKIGELNLANITYVNSYAFRSNSIAKIYGYNVETVGSYAFSSNTSLIYVTLPKLKAGIGTADGAYFSGCTKLVYAHVGPMDSGVQSQIFNGCSSLKFVTVDTTNRLDGAAVPSKLTTGNTAMFLIIGKSSSGFSNARQVNEDFSNIIVKDSKTYSVTVNGVEYSITLPKSTYRINNDGRTVELIKFCESTVTQTRYTIPAQAYKATTTAQFFGHTVYQCDDYIEGSNNGYAVTKVAPYTYSGVSFGETIFNTGVYIKSVAQGDFAGLSVKKLELENVTSVGAHAFSGWVIQTLKADKLETIGAQGFSNCTNLTAVSLPSIKKLEKWTFWDTGITTLYIGESLTSIGVGDFADCENLRTVTILCDPSKVSSLMFYDHIGYPGEYMGTLEEEITFKVPAEYFDRYNEYWSSIIKEVKTVEGKYSDTVNGIDYYYNIISGNNVEINSFEVREGYSVGSTFTFPSQFTIIKEDLTSTTYTVTQLSKSAYKSVGSYAIDTIVLPSGLNILNDSLDAVPEGIKALQINASNTVFKTVNGVLYTYDMSTLIFYPKGKTDTEFIIPSDVRSIADGAFSQNEYIEQISASSKLLIVGNAFNGCSALKSLTFTSTDACVFVGTGIFTGCNEELKIYVPAEKVEAYKSGLIFDFAMRDNVVAIS